MQYLFGNAPKAPAAPTPAPTPAPAPASTPAPAPAPELEPDVVPVAPAPAPVPEPEPEAIAAQPALKPYRLVGEVFHSYLLVEMGDTMLLIDKHAAHERIIFEELKARMKAAGKDRGMDAQLLLLPIEVMLMSEEVGLLEEYRAELEAVGFTYSCLRNTVRVESIPSGVAPGAVPEMIATVAEHLRGDVNNATLTRDIFFEKALYQASCKAAIKAGRDYPAEQLGLLVDKLMALPDITVCPHGRPVAMEMKKRNIDRQFERC